MTKLKRQRFIALLLIPAFFWLIYNNVANWHLHQLSTGWVVSHAHPYNHKLPVEKPGQTHQHTAFQLLILDQMAELLSIALLSLLMVLMVWLQGTQIPRPVFWFSCLHPCFSWINLRGPPVITV